MTTKEEILEIALQLFTKEGYENTGVARIVTEAGVSKPTLYHHFGNKEGLLNELMSQYGKGLKAVFSEKLHYKGDIIGAIDQLVIAYLHYVKREPRLFKLYKQLYQSPEASDSYRIVKPLYQAINLEVTDFFKEVSEHHTGLAEKVEWMAYSLIGLIDSYIIHHIIQNDLEQMQDETARQVAKQFLYGVFS